MLDNTLGAGVPDGEKDQSEYSLWTESEDGDVDTYLINMVRGDAGRLGTCSAETGDEYYLTASANDKDADRTSFSALMMTDISRSTAPGRRNISGMNSDSSGKIPILL